jgi:hypothetical protein
MGGNRRWSLSSPSTPRWTRYEGALCGATRPPSAEYGTTYKSTTCSYSSSGVMIGQLDTKTSLVSRVTSWLPTVTYSSPTRTRFTDHLQHPFPLLPSGTRCAPAVWTHHPRPRRRPRSPPVRTRVRSLPVLPGGDRRRRTRLGVTFRMPRTRQLPARGSPATSPSPSALEMVIGSKTDAPPPEPGEHPGLQQSRCRST